MPDEKPPRMVIVGEKGPEMFVPHYRGHIVRQSRIDAVRRLQWVIGSCLALCALIITGAALIEVLA